VPTTLEVEGNSMVLGIRHVGRELAYPIALDPVTHDYRWTGQNVNDFWNWNYYESADWNGVATGDENFYYGPGLYLGSWGHLWYGQNSFAEWFFPAYGDTFINRADFGRYVHSPYNTGMAVGIWNYGVGWWEPEGNWGWGQCGGYLASPRVDYDGHGSASDDSCGLQHHYARADRGYSSGSANAAVFELFATTTTPGGALSYLRDARVQVHDLNPPSFDQASLGLPTGWVSSASGPINLTARDGGVGMKYFYLDREGLSTQGGSASNCTGSREWLCPATWYPGYTSLSTSFNYSTSDFPEGKSTIVAHADDVVGNRRSLGGVLHIDRSSPTITGVSGSLKSTQGDLFESSYTLNVDAADGSWDSGRTQRSGMKSIEVLVDGVRVANGYQEQACPDGSCGMSRTFTVDPSGLSAGTHTVKVLARDQIGNTPTEATFQIEVPTPAERVEWLANLAYPDAVAPSDVVTAEDGATYDPSLSGTGPFTSTGTAVPNTRFSGDPAAGFSLPTDAGELTVTPSSTGGGAAAGTLAKSGDAVVFPSVLPATHFVTRPRPDGVETFVVLESAAAPTSFSWELALAGDETLLLTPSGSVLVTAPDVLRHRVVAEIHPPNAVDRSGSSIPASFTISGDSLTMTLTTAGAAYPVVAEPWVSRRKSLNTDLVDQMLGSEQTCCTSAGGSMTVGKSERVIVFRAKRRLYFGYNDDFELPAEVGPDEDPRSLIERANNGASRIIRIGAPWCRVQDQRNGSFNFDFVTRQLSEVRRLDRPNDELTTVVTLSAAPYWASEAGIDDPDGQPADGHGQCGAENYAPAMDHDSDPANSSLDEWQVYLRAFMDQMSGARGRYFPVIDAVEIWNEPNLATDWRADPGETDQEGADPSGYAQLFAAAHDAITPLKPPRGLTVLAGSLSPQPEPSIDTNGDGEGDVPNPRHAAAYLAAAFAEIPSAKRPNGLGVHLYASGKDTADDVRKAMTDQYEELTEALPESARQIERWVTEFGFPSRPGAVADPPDNRDREALQRDALGEVFRYFRQGDVQPKPQALIVHRLRDLSPEEITSLEASDGKDGPHPERKSFGTLRHDNQRKPAFCDLAKRMRSEPHTCRVGD
jgi:hypothetical protein